MKLFIRISAAVMLSIGIAMLLSLVGELDKNLMLPGGEPLVAFSDHTSKSITQETIVNDLVSLKLRVQLRRVVVETSVLEVDASVADEQLERETVLEDLGRLAALALGESDNISRVFIRITESDRSGKESLLVALSGSKSDFSASELQRLRDGEPMPVEWVKEKMRLTETEAWNKRIR